MKIRVLIIEDEPATARHLKHTLEQTGLLLEVIGIVATVKQSVEWFTKHADDCDLAFMDIQLSDGLSFEIFNQVNISIPVIFVTAYNDYALQAFKANGIDYVLKPFDDKEIKQALDKFEQFFGKQRANTAEQLQAVLQQIQVKQAYKKSFLLHYRDKLIPVSTDEISWFFSQNEVVQAATIKNSYYIVEDTLENLQQQLNPEQFFRANRQFIINRKSIQEVNFFFNGRLQIKVSPAPKENILVSKARVPEFKQWMNS